METAEMRTENEGGKHETPPEARGESTEQATATGSDRTFDQSVPIESPRPGIQGQHPLGGKGNDWSPSMEDAAGAPQAVSAVLSDACGNEQETRTAAAPKEQCLRHHAAYLEDNGDRRRKGVSSSSNDSTGILQVDKSLEGYDVVDTACSTNNKLPERPASNPVNTHNPGSSEIVSDSYSPAEQEPAWAESATQTVIGPTILKAGSGRPTSVPNFHSHSNFDSKSASRGHRDEAPHPSSSDQSFVAGHTHRRPTLRTRSSQSSHNPSYSSDSSAFPSDFADMPLGAKTVGNTPSQSPGLFSPTIPRSSPFTQYPESLHAAHSLHLQAPIETHKLNKDVDPVSGRKTLNEYELSERLGSGNHGTVKLGRNLATQQTVAVKIVRRFSKRLRLLRHGDPSDIVKKEVAILKKARHPHVVSLLEVIDDDEFGKIYLVLEFVERGEIVWRKNTGRDVANFEMKRVKREKAGMRDESFELEEVERFNQGAPARRLEKLRLEQMEEARLKALLTKDVAASYWSLEHSGSNEQEWFDGRGAKPIDAFEIANMGLLDATPTPESSPQGSTPKQRDTPRPAPLDTMALETVTPESLSRPESTKEMSDLKLKEGPSSNLEGTMYGPCMAETPYADEPLRWNPQDFTGEQTQWSKEEEQYMHVPCLTIYQIQKAFRQTVLGLEYLHFQGIIHRDIKPANLLWTEGFDVKISDFGVSYLGKPLGPPIKKNEELEEANDADINEAVELAKTVGTPAFYAPEMCDPDLFDLEKNPQRPRINGQVDVWALGVTLYCMVFGRLPFVDNSEMGMYAKIAREEVFIPRVRLRGVENSDKDPETNDKRMDHIIEYEPVDDELHDLIKQLLRKKPSERINIKEVKHHPWVLRGINDLSAWVDETDPLVQSQGKKIEVSNEDVAGAILPYTLVDRVKAGLRRLGSVVRGRDARKRTKSNAKPSDSPNSMAPRGNSSAQDGRRASLRGDEQIYTALRASREGFEHPLSQSVTASPELKTSSSYFDPGNGSSAGSLNSSPRPGRPGMSERTLSSAESAKTVKATVPAIQEIIVSPGEPFSSLTTPIDTSSSSSLGGIFHGAGRRFVNSMRSRERGHGRDSPSRSSRSSSADANASNIEDPHASPSLAISSAVAAGRVDQPPVLREELSPADLYWAAPTSSPSPSQTRTEIPNEALQQAQERHFRHQIHEATEVGPTYAEVASGKPQTPCPVSPDDDLFYAQQHRPTPRVSSSSDQMASGTISESFSHPSVPSVVSGASSFSAAYEGDNILRLSKEASPSHLVPKDASENSSHGGVNAGHHPEGAKAHTADDDEAGYNGEGEMDSDSDEDILMMGPKK